MQLRKDGGFDAVVGNPPYQVMENIDTSQRTYFYSLNPDGTKIYEGAESKANIYSIFWEASLRQLTNNAHLGMVTPYSWVSNSSFRALRSFLKSNATLRFVSAFDVGVFENVGIATGIFIIQNKMPIDDDTVRLLDARGIHVHNLEAILNVDSEMIQDVNTKKLWKEDEIVNLSYKKHSDSILTKIEADSYVLSEIFDVVYGCKTADASIFTGMAYLLSRNAKKLLSGEDIARHEYEWQGRYIYYEPERMIDLHETARPGEATRFEAPEKLIVYRFLDRDRRFVSIYDAEQHYCLDSTYVVTAKEETKENLAYIQCLLVSNLLGFYNRLFAGVKVTQTEMERIPIHPVHFTTPADERERLIQEAIGVYGIGDNAGVIRLVQAHINSDKTDVLHDLLVHLAQRMIDINKQKQAEVKRFLGWLEKRLKILPKNDSSTGIDSLTGKAILRGYLGDYQKSEGETPWREFHYRLYQNRNRFAVSLSDVQGEIQREYETSLETLLPINSELTPCSRNTNHHAALQAFAIFTFTLCSTWFVMTRNRSAC